MIQDDLLSINPDKLFQSHTVSEIEQIQKKLQNEIQRKREELRAMVGERYRDLIKAADTVEEMEATTRGIISDLSNLRINSDNLHKKFSVGYEIKEKRVKESFLSITNIYSIATQVKILMDIPEKIWKHLEAEDYLSATKLFLLARHINTGLQLQLSVKNLKNNLSSLKLIVERQWHNISGFSSTINITCKNKLQNNSIDDQIACSCLLSIHLLDTSKDLTELLNTLITIHTNHILKNILLFDLLDGETSKNMKDVIKQKILQSLKVIVQTLLLTYNCFVEDGGGKLLAVLKEIYSKESAPLIELVQLNDEAMKVLPPVITAYRLSSNKNIAFSKSEVVDVLNKWMKWVEALVQEKVEILLRNITSAKLLQQIRDEAIKIEIPSKWTEICAELDAPDTNIWVQYFQPLLTKRAKEIVDSKWLKIVDSFKTQIIADLQHTSRKDCEEKEVDINWYVWKDLIGDTIIESREKVLPIMESLMKEMWLQDRGFTPRLEKICRSLDNDISNLLVDLNYYLYGSTTNDAILTDEEDDTTAKFSDRTALQIHLREVSLNSVECILKYIEADCIHGDFRNSELEEKTVAIYTSRFLQALPLLLPNLKKCFIPDKTYVYMAGNTLEQEGTKCWLDLCSNLKENCLRCWSRWVDISVARVNSLTGTLPKDFTLEDNIEFLLVQWDVIAIEEKDEEGKPIQSVIKIPSGPSLKLQEYLYDVSRILEEVVPHTLPQEVHSLFIEKVTDLTLSHYSRVIREKETNINQKCALQLLMDIRHFTLLIVPRENKRMMDLSLECCEVLKQKIDPFDYDVFYPFIQTNVKRSVQRVQTILGSLVSHHEQLSSVLGPKVITSGGSADKSPALLTPVAAEGGAWFSLLPASAPQPHQKKLEKVKKKGAVSSSPGKAKSEISELMSSSLPINLASARSGAAAFFGSMTSDWFTGS